MSEREQHSTQQDCAKMPYERARVVCRSTSKASDEDLKEYHLCDMGQRDSKPSRSVIIATRHEV